MTVTTALMVISRVIEFRLQLLLSTNSCPHRSGKDGQQSLGTWYEPISGTYTSPSFFAPADMRIVRRSNFLLGNTYGEQTVSMLNPGPVLQGCWKHRLSAWKMRWRCPVISAVFYHSSRQIPVCDDLSAAPRCLSCSGLWSDGIEKQSKWGLRRERLAESAMEIVAVALPEHNHNFVHQARTSCSTRRSATRACLRLWQTSCLYGPWACSCGWQRTGPCSLAG